MKRLSFSRGLKTLRQGLFFRTIGFSWSIAFVAVMIFVFTIIPSQKKVFNDHLVSKAEAIAASLQEITSGSAVSEDYTAVVDHSMTVLSRDDSVLFLVVTRNDGYSLVHNQNEWKVLELGERWHPANRQNMEKVIDQSPFADEQAFVFSKPFGYSGIEWGWLHVGLSMQAYHANIKRLYQLVAYGTAVSLIAALAASIVYARQLARPIFSLRDTLKKISQGHLEIQAKTEGAQEVAELAQSVNQMSQSLKTRSSILESLSMTAQQLLATTRWEDVMPTVLTQFGQAVTVCQVSLYQCHLDESEDMHFDLIANWYAADNSPLAGPMLTDTESLPQGRVVLWQEELLANRCVAGDVENISGPAIRKQLIEAGMKRAMTMPIFVEGQLWGFINICTKEETRVWKQTERNALRTIADMFGSAIERSYVQHELISAKESAEAASQAKTRFLANMSHDLRTPINGVIGMLQLLQHTKGKTKHPGYINTALSSARSLLNVVGNILDLSKIEAGKLELEEYEFCLEDLCADIVEPFGEQADRKKLELAYHIDASASGWWFAAGNRIQQILINLLGNAFKFTDEGEILLKCSARPLEGEQAELIFEVIDTGSGIAPADQDRIFESFVQADDSLTRSHTGTGLGLTICRDLCRLMNGKISLKSKVGTGSTFYVNLPARKLRAQTSVSITDGTLSELNEAKALIIDDSSSTVRILKDYLSAWGFQTDSLTNPSTILSDLDTLVASSGNAYDLVLLESVLPDVVDIFSFFRQLKMHPGLRKAKFILLERFSQRLRRHTLFSHGFDASIAKPIGKSELCETIMDAFSEQPQVPQEPVPDETSTETNVLSTSGRVLVAEDNEVNQEVSSELITRLGFAVETVGNGQATLERIQQGGIDLLFLDCQMPVMDGYTTAKAIRDWELSQKTTSSKRLPIIAVTAHAMKGDRERCLEVGMDDYLSKPLEFHMLKDMLEKWYQPKEKLEEHPSVDTDALLRRFGGDVQIASRMLSRFLEDSQVSLQRMEKAVTTQDLKALRYEAHRWRGAAVSVSALRMNESIREIEDLEIADWEHHQKCLDSLKRELTQLESVNLARSAEFGLQS